MKEKKKRKPFENPDLTNRGVREKIAREYRPLMNKIANQWEGKCPLDRELLMMLAEDGLLYAMDHFREGTSQNFIQYAAWCMRNLILNGISEYGSTVRLNSGQRKKLMDDGKSTYITFSIDRCPDDETDCELSDFISKHPEEMQFDLTDKDQVLKNLTDFVDQNFNQRHRDIFYSTYELKGYKKMKGKDLSKKYHCTAALISQSNRHVLEAIRGQEDLMEALDSLRGRV